MIRFKLRGRSFNLWADHF